MSIDSVLHQLGLKEDPHSLDAQLRSMRREVRHIAKVLSGQVSRNADEWSDQLADLTRDAARRTAHFADLAGSQAMRGADLLRRDPLPAIAVIGTGLLLMRLLRRN